jgi:phosphatidylserine/phosphatidylglycerophosphate/cardiolipin synthase-like enzyme
MPAVLIGDQYVPAVVQLLQTAKQKVDIIVFDWRRHPHDAENPVSKLEAALVDAQRRGVKVRVITSSDTVCAELRTLGFITHRQYFAKLVHAKMMLLDDRIAVVGSHNFTQNAFTTNIEVSVVVDFESTANPLSAYFKNLWPL